MSPYRFNSSGLRSTTSTIPSLSSSSSSTSIFSPKSEYHYNNVFNAVCSTRFQKLARFIASSTWILTFILALPTDISFVSKLLPLRAIPIAVGFFLLACLKKYSLHVDFLGYKTLSSQILGQLANKNFLLTLAFYWVSAFLYFFTLHGALFSDLKIKDIPLKHQYPLLNDQFVFLYYLCFFIALIYSLQHSVLDRDRLVFRYGYFHQHPRDSLIRDIPSIVSGSIIYTGISTVLGSIVYLFVRHYVYDILFVVLNPFYALNTNYPSLSISLFFYLKLTAVGFFLVLSWEVLNAGFNAYLSIGCLHRGNTLSELSKDPLMTLLTGLRSEKPFAKLTAFQELAYISKSNDQEGREAIYNRNNRRDVVWRDILTECEKVIKQNNSNINFVLDQNLLMKSTSVNPVTQTTNAEQDIFGRDYYNPTEFRDTTIRAIPLSESTPSLLDNNIISVIVENGKLLIQLIQYYYANFLQSNLGVPFRYTALRESERICPIPVTVGNAIIAISLLSTHAYDEDKRGTISSTIGDILEILERSVITCGRFINNYPEYLVETQDDNIVTLLHELSINAFFEVTIKYKAVLRDLVLSPEATRLVNWTLENAAKDDF
ncbi:hypothetical protein WICPIJ_001296 [Wickerhamomyces pijperi]|uniref:Nucleoporin NDC1 n=1 Tax=Wickerhamomyces pijperi TaxID=599730 RepID=A0A9P8QBV4_WICPI|nr:hypothetical protein WICPIJ_001296 [Wickerhamomyces pijperi]